MIRFGDFDFVNFSINRHMVAIWPRQNVNVCHPLILQGRIRDFRTCNIPPINILAHIHIIVFWGVSLVCFVISVIKLE